MTLIGYTMMCEQAGPKQPSMLLSDDHLHMALIVVPDGRLVTTIERPDLAVTTSAYAPVAKLGTLIERTAGPADPLGAATATLVREGRRRPAVVDDSGRLLGLLCLKKDGTGYCSDEGIRERAQRATQPRNQHSQAGCTGSARSGAITLRAIGVLPSSHPY